MEHYKKGKFTGSHMTKAKKSAMVQAMEKTLCNVSMSCRYVGISRTTHMRWTKSDIEYKRVIHELKERALDFVEAALFKKIAEGSCTAIIFHLKCKGKERGYVEHRYMPNYTPLPKKTNSMEGKTVQELLDIIAKESMR